MSSEFIAFTTETIFERLLLENYTSHLLFNHATFMGFCDAQDHLFKSKELPENFRSVLYPKRFAEAWFYYMTLKFHLEINVDLSNFAFCNLINFDDHLRCIKNLLLPHFIKKWSGI